MLVQLTQTEVFSFLLVFCRFSSAVMVIPGIGEGYVNPRSRLLFALLTTLIITPLVQSMIPKLPGTIMEIFLLVLAEIMVGLFIGLSIRMLLGAIHIAGIIIATQSGLASAMLFDATAGAQGAIVGNFLTLLMLVVIFASDSHYLMLHGLLVSYTLFKPGDFPPVSDFSDFATQTMSDTFMIAVKIASPLLVIITIITLAGGVLGRLMPQLQIFFLMMPVQIAVSFSLIILTISGMMLWYLDYFNDKVAGFLLH